MISDGHRKMLAASGITEDHIEARGYETVVARHRLEKLGFVKAACKCVPGLLFPVLDFRGSTVAYQYRPDDPRLRKDGKPIKYEWPYDHPGRIDVPPGVGDYLGDPCVPLWITEGIKKADCGALHGLCVVALIGVWNFRGRNDLGGITALGDWNDIALRDRDVIIAYDSDMAHNPQVARAACALADYLKYKKATPRFLYLPEGVG